MLDPTIKAAIVAEMSKPGAVAAEVGKRLGVSANTARIAAIKHGVYAPAKHGPRPKPVEKSLEQFYQKYPSAKELLGKLPDAEAGRRLNISGERVRQIREKAEIALPERVSYHRFVLSPEQEALLGELSDAEVAEQVGCAQSTIFMRRAQKGIPARGQSQIKPFLDLFGKIPDVEIAKLAGLTSYAVARYRQRHPGLPLSPLSPRCKKQQS